MTSSKIYINELCNKILHNVYNPILKVFCKFQVDISINARFTAVQSLENLHTFILWQPCWRAKECSAAHFPHKITKNVTLLAHRSIFVGSNDFKFGKGTCHIILQTRPKFQGNWS